MCSAVSLESTKPVLCSIIVWIATGRRSVALLRSREAIYNFLADQSRIRCLCLSWQKVPSVGKDLRYLKMLSWSGFSSDWVKESPIATTRLFPDLSLSRAKRDSKHSRRFQSKPNTRLLEIKLFWSELYWLRIACAYGYLDHIYSACTKQVDLLIAIASHANLDHPGRPLGPDLEVQMGGTGLIIHSVEPVLLNLGSRRYSQSRSSQTVLTSGVNGFQGITIDSTSNIGSTV